MKIIHSVASSEYEIPQQCVAKYIISSLLKEKGTKESKGVHHKVDRNATENIPNRKHITQQKAKTKGANQMETVAQMIRTGIIKNKLAGDTRQENILAGYLC